MQQNKNRGKFWMFLPVILLVTSVSGWLFMVSIAVDDPGFAVEADYYKKASHFDDVIAQRAKNQQLGYRVSIARFEKSGPAAAALELIVVDAVGAPISGAKVTAEAFPVARAAAVQTVSLSSRGEGSYGASLEGPRPGLWEVRLVVSHDGETFTQSLRADLQAVTTSKGAPPS